MLLLISAIASYLFMLFGLVVHSWNIYRIGLLLVLICVVLALARALGYNPVRRRR